MRFHHTLQRVMICLVGVLSIMVWMAGSVGAEKKSLSANLPRQINLRFSGENVFDVKADKKAIPPNVKVTGTGPLEGLIFIGDQIFPLSIGTGAVEITIVYEYSPQGMICVNIMVIQGVVTLVGQGEKIEVGKNKEICVESKQAPPVPSADFPHGKKASNPKPK